MHQECSLALVYRMQPRRVCVSGGSSKTINFPLLQHQSCKHQRENCWLLFWGTLTDDKQNCVHSISMPIYCRFFRFIFTFFSGFQSIFHSTGLMLIFQRHSTGSDLICLVISIYLEPFNQNEIGCPSMITAQNWCKHLRSQDSWKEQVQEPKKIWWERGSPTLTFYTFLSLQRCFGRVHSNNSSLSVLLCVSHSDPFVSCCWQIFHEEHEEFELLYLKLATATHSSSLSVSGCKTEAAPDRTFPYSQNNLKTVLNFLYTCTEEVMFSPALVCLWATTE